MAVLVVLSTQSASAASPDRSGQKGYLNELGPDVNGVHDVAVDRNGTAHVLMLQSSGYVYATWDGKKWGTLEAIRPFQSIGTLEHIAVDSRGGVSIVFPVLDDVRAKNPLSGAGSTSLQVVERGPTGWGKPVVIDTNAVGISTGVIEDDRNKAPAMVYVGDDNEVRISRRVGGQWKRVAVVKVKGLQPVKPLAAVIQAGVLHVLIAGAQGVRAIQMGPNGNVIKDEVLDSTSSQNAAVYASKTGEVFAAVQQLVGGRPAGLVLWQNKGAWKGTTPLGSEGVEFRDYALHTGSHGGLEVTYFNLARGLFESARAVEIANRSSVHWFVFGVEDTVSRPMGMANIGVSPEGLPVLAFDSPDNGIRIKLQ